ncbi:hypothetical protein ES703_68355 [subsurface metagenome]
MLAKVLSCAVVGLEGAIVEVEVDISPGLPSFTIVGLPDTAVQEARERVRAAIRNSGCSFPMKRIVVNLAPANLKKAQSRYMLMLLKLSSSVSCPWMAAYATPMASCLWLLWLIRKGYPPLLCLRLMLKRHP